MGCDRGIFGGNGCAWLVIVLVIIFWFGFSGGGLLE
jgi:hypothetical protein